MEMIKWPFLPKDAGLDIVKTEGAYLYTRQGQKILDAASGAIVNNIGYGREEVAEAIKEAALNNTYVLPPFLTPEREELLDELRNHWLPPHLTRVHLSSGGSEANESAVKLAIQYQASRGKPEKNLILTRTLSYHGTTLNMSGISGHAARKRGLESYVPAPITVETPYPLRCPLGSFHPEAKDYYLNNLKELISKNSNIKDYILPKREKSENVNQNIIQTENLCFSYDKKNNVLNNINLNFKKNELTAILGANGSGKSTLSLVLSYALKPTKGKVIKDKNIKIGYIFQEPSYQILSTTVREELAFGPKQLKFKKDQIDKITLFESERFGLELNQNPINLSPENLRKLTIASILAINPDIIIFDEPTNTLDENEITKPSVRNGISLFFVMCILLMIK